MSSSAYFFACSSDRLLVLDMALQHVYGVTITCSSVFLFHEFAPGSLSVFSVAALVFCCMSCSV